MSPTMHDVWTDSPSFWLRAYSYALGIEICELCMKDAWISFTNTFPVTLYVTQTHSNLIHTMCRQGVTSHEPLFCFHRVLLGLHHKQSLWYTHITKMLMMLNLYVAQSNICGISCSWNMFSSNIILTFTPSISVWDPIPYTRHDKLFVGAGAMFNVIVTWALWVRNETRM